MRAPAYKWIAPLEYSILIHGRAQLEAAIAIMQRWIRVDGQDVDDGFTFRWSCERFAFGYRVSAELLGPW